MDIGEGELNRLGVIRALPNACGATCSAELFLVAPQAHLRMNAKCILLEKSMSENDIYIVAVAL